MMNPKTTIGLVAALAIAVIGVWWAQSSSSPEAVVPDRAGPKALFDPPLGALTGFELKAGDAPALAFVMEEKKWRMTAPVSGPGEHGGVDRDAKKIKNLQYVRSYGPGDPDRPTASMTGLDDPPRIVKLTDETDTSFVVKIGRRQALSNKTYVQKEGDETVYLVDEDLNKSLRKGLSDYRGKRVTELETDDAVRIEVGGEQRYTLVKSDGKWMVDAPIKGRADSSKVRSLLSGLSNLRVSKFIEDAPPSLRPYGLDVPRLRVAVTTETKTPKPPPAPPASAPAEPEYEIETRTVRVAFGGEAEDRVFAKIDETSSPTVFQVSSSVVDRIGPTLTELRDKKITTINTTRAQKIAVFSEGESVALEKSGTTWRIEGAGDEGAAEFAAVDDLLQAVRDLTAIGFETEALPTHGFDRPRVRLEVTAEGQVEPATLLVGGLTPSKTGAYVRNEREGFIAVVKAEAAEALVVKPMAFLSREVMRFPRGRASNILLERRDGSVSARRVDGQWRFVSPIQGETETERVDDILSDLSNLRGRRVVGRSKDVSRFGLDAPAVKATITIDAPPKPKKPTTTQPATQSATAPAEEPEEAPAPPTLHTVLVTRHDEKVYAMAVGGQTICEVDGKVLEDLEAELLDTQVASFDPAEVTRLALSGAQTFAFEKSDDAWALSGEPTYQTDNAKIKEMCEALRDLRAKRYVQYGGTVPTEYGLDRPAVVVTVVTQDGATLALSISGEGPEGGDRYCAVSSAAGRVFVIASDDAAKFMKTVRDFAQGG